MGDSNRLQQVIWNLLSNAVKFTPEGGKVEVGLSVVTRLKVNNLKVERREDNIDYGFCGAVQPSNLQPSTSYAQIQVSDTGQGINPDFLPHVFEHFRQEDSTTTRVFGGLGLGLAIVRHLIELHGGTVYAESPGEGLGATFTVTLPLIFERPSNSEENNENSHD